MKNKYLYVFMVLMIILCMSSSCGTQVTEPLVSDTSTESTTSNVSDIFTESTISDTSEAPAESTVSYTSDVPEESTTSVVLDVSESDISKINDALSVYDINNDGYITVYFIGNSFTYSGDIPLKLKQIAATQGLELRIYQRTLGGYTLGLHYSDLNGNSEYIKYIEQSDIVILQDYGGYIGYGFDEKYVSTFEVVPKIQALFSEEVIFYYYPFTTSSDIYNAQINQYNNIEFIDTGDLFNKIISEYDESYFRLSDGHNNDLCSYIFAIAMYCDIFGADCTDIPYDNILASTYIPGDTDEEKNNNMIKFKEYIMEVVSN